MGCRAPYFFYHFRTIFREENRVEEELMRREEMASEYIRKKLAREEEEKRMRNPEVSILLISPFLPLLSPIFLPLLPFLHPFPLLSFSEYCISSCRWWPVLYYTVQVLAVMYFLLQVVAYLRGGAQAATMWCHRTPLTRFKLHTAQFKLHTAS